MKLKTSILFLVICFTLSLKIVAKDIAILQDETDSLTLSRAKFKLISGDIAMSEFYLNRIIDNEHSPYYPIKKRYLALIEFIKGNYKKSNLILDQIPKADIFYNGASYPQICQLRILNALAINDIETIKLNSTQCQSSTSNSSKNGQIWMDTMIKLRLQDSKGIRLNLQEEQSSNSTSEEKTKIWLKTGLYLNHEKDFIKLVPTLDEESYHSNRIKEIIGFLYFRNGNSEKALAFVNNIESANAENIKGNISLKKNEYEIAYGHFKLALQKKQDSINALERSIPLTWFLKQFEDGPPLLDNPTLQKLDSKNRRSLKIAYLIKLKKFAEAEKELQILNSEYNNHPPSNVTLLAIYLSIINGTTEKYYDKKLSEELAEKSCQSFDGLNCWVAMKLAQWENLGKTIRRKDEIFSDKNMTIESLKAPATITPLNEENHFDQVTIEELDSQTVNVK